MRVLKNAWFEKFCQKEDISDEMLLDAVKRAENGQIDANLGSGLIRQRVARSGGGKSGGYRTLVFFRSQTRAIFAYGFAKSQRDNISDAEETTFRKTSKILLALSEKEIDVLIERKRLIEVKNEQDL